MHQVVDSDSIKHQYDFEKVIRISKLDLLVVRHVGKVLPQLRRIKDEET